MMLICGQTVSGNNRMLVKVFQVFLIEYNWSVLEVEDDDAPLKSHEEWVKQVCTDRCQQVIGRNASSDCKFPIIGH